MKNETALFGAAGNSDSYSAHHKSSLDAPKWLKDEMNLDAYEYQCGRGVQISDATAAKIGDSARASGIALSIHSPYYINLSNLTLMEGNIRYIMQSYRAAKAMGATRIVVHAGSVSGKDRSEALRDNATTIDEALKATHAAGYTDITLCIETMGKVNQMGSFDEIMALCANDERLLPCIDFGHLYARTLGECSGYEATKALYDKMENEIGIERASQFHAHFSKIEYSKGGEKRHIKFSNPGFGPDFQPVVRLIAERGYAPVIICESDGTQAEDAKMMKEVYLKEHRKR